MRKTVDITINQKPTSVTFNCPHCEDEIDVEYEEFKKIVDNDLCGLLYDTNYFACPNCNESLKIDRVEWD